MNEIFLRLKRFFLLLVVLASVIPFASSQSRIIHGLLISDANAGALPLANILNKSTQKRYLTNRQGYFHIPVATSDSFIFTSVGFDPLLISGAELLKPASDTLILMMHTGSYVLNDVTIVYSNRKRDSIARIVADIIRHDTLLNNNDRIFKRPRGGPGTSNGSLGISGPITELYYQFSKEGKDMVHFEQFVSYYREVQEADKRYNRKVIRKVTGLAEEHIDDFILYCKMDRKFIIDATDYDLIKAIKTCESNFRDKKGTH